MSTQFGSLVPTKPKKPIFHHNVNFFALQLHVGLAPQRIALDTQREPIPLCWYPKSLADPTQPSSTQRKSSHTQRDPQLKGANPQRVLTEIIIEIKQLYSGRIASNPFIASNGRYMLYPLRDDFPIEKELLD